MSGSKHPHSEALAPKRLPKDYDISRIRELALGAIKQSVLIMDSDREDRPIIFANRAFYELTGYTTDEVIGRDSSFLSGPDTSVEKRKAVYAAFAEKKEMSGLILSYRKDGSAFWNDFTVIPVGGGDEGNFCVCVLIDVTERRDMEMRLRESQRMEAIGKLSGGIAHDFNNILALILGNAEIIAAEATSGSLEREAATDIMEAADSGARLITRMLQYARGEAGETEEVLINEVIESVAALLSRTIGEQVRVTTDLSAAVGRVMIDRTLFETALLNLALNARDAMPDGGAIRISSRRRSNAGTTLGTAAVIAVSDSGTGMDDETKERAFEPFYTTKAAGQGSGLGLAMVYNFVKQTGGDVAVDSILGRGTTVTMMLPIEEPPVRAIAADDTRLQVLIVEDEAKVRKILALHLERGGFAVVDVASAEEALALIESGLEPAMLVSDIRLRDGMTGVELVDILRDRKADWPMLLMTGFSDELEENASQIKGIPVLRKPFRSEALLAEVNRVVPPAAQRPRRK